MKVDSVKIDKKFKALLLGMSLLHLGIIFAGFVAPYGSAEQERSSLYAAPSTLRFSDANNRWHWRPKSCTAIEGVSNSRTNNEYQKCTPIRFFVHGTTYRILGIIESSRHLFGVDSQNKIFLLGSDGFGRDVFSRLLYGSQLSLASGILATLLTLTLGTALGTVAGYYGGWVDAALMRCAEMFLALPWLYLLFAIRAFLPLHISPARTFLLLIAVIGVVGWARPARLVRGIVLSGKERGYCLAARGFGGSDLYLMRRHLLPQTYSVLLTQAALLIPQYVLAEVTLSFLGLGVGEPVASWGNMLATLQQYDVLVSYWWMWAPGIAAIPVFFSYQLLGNALQERAEYSACQ